jgi:hypothetical protein
MRRVLAFMAVLLPIAPVSSLAANNYVTLLVSRRSQHDCGYGEHFAEYIEK